MMWVLITVAILLMVIAWVPIDYQVSLSNLGPFKWLWKIQWSWGFGLLTGTAVKTPQQKASGLFRLMQGGDKVPGLLEIERRAKVLWRDIEPCLVYIQYGFENPYYTGLMTGLMSACILPWFYEKNSIFLNAQFVRPFSERQIAILGRMPTVIFCYLVVKRFLLKTF